jgi:predicted nucleic acid-binding protein
VKIVVDASVVVKWCLPDPEVEPDLETALTLLRGIRYGDLEILQPPHWFAEVAAVLARLAPGKVYEVLDLLDALELPVADDLAVYKRGAALARRLDHHLFDTLYHAVALEHGATLVSADGAYCDKAIRFGSLVRLAEWEEGPPG